MSVQSETSHWPFSLLPTTTTVPSFLSPAVLNSPVLMATISVHLEILLDVHSVAHRRSDVELAKSGFEECIFVGGVGVLGLSGEVERAASLKFGMSVDEEAGFLLS